MPTLVPTMSSTVLRSEVKTQFLQYSKPTMERNCAASLQEWSIDLEKGLRSKNPSEAISQIGARLKQWSQQPISTPTSPNMYNLIPGEEKLFTNTIFLRLADAFLNGNNHLRVCILNAFSFLRNGDGDNNKFLCKDRVVNYKEVLRRVKVVYDQDEEDGVTRAICLRLLGCFSGIGCHSEDIRFMVLCSLGKCDLEVKAAVFAAGCFSELSGDFGVVFLEVLVEKVKSRETSNAVKLACARGFARLGRFFTLARRGYDKGRELVVENSGQEEFVCLMLVSLSKLAGKSMLLVSQHVEFLLSFIGGNECVLRVKGMALRCMLFLLGGGVGRFPVNGSFLSKLFDILNNEELPLVIQRQVLRVLVKVFQSAHPSFSCTNASESVRWMSIVENVIQSPVLSNRLLAFRLLVEIFIKYIDTVKTLPEGNGHSDVPSHVLLLVLDQIAKMVKLVLNPCETASKLSQECQSLLNLVLCIIDRCPTLGGLALNKIKLCIETLVLSTGGIRTEPGSPKHVTLLSEGEKHCTFVSKFVFFMYKFVEHCMETLHESNAVTAEVHDIMKVIIELMHTKFFLNPGGCTIVLILLHFRIMWCYFANENMESSDFKSFSSPPTVYWLEHEKLIHQFLKKMVVEQDNWAAYKAGKLAACQGAWFAAAFAFRHLIDTAQSNGCQQWLKSLALFSRSESTMMLPFVPHQGLVPVCQSQMDEIWVTKCGLLGGNVGGASCNSVLDDCLKSVNKAHGDVCAAVEMLVASVPTDDTFFFQRWFLNIRAKVLQIVIDILRLLNSNALKEQNVDKVRHANGYPSITFGGPSLDAHYLTHCFTVVSFRLNRLAQELDLLDTSFMDMDLKSHRTISLLALNCSLLAFCTGFALYFPGLHSHGHSLLGLEILNKCSHPVLVQNLLSRLQHIDREMTTNLMRVLALIGEPDSCVHSPPTAHVYKAGQREKETLSVCKFALSGFLGMLEDAKLKQEGGQYHDSRTRLELMFNVLKRWMNISFQAPKYFFQVRSCVGAELFVFNADTRNPNGLSILPGFHLSLNLCLQLRHVPPSRPTKVYCILTCKPSDRATGHSGQSEGKEGENFPSPVTNETLDMNEKLWKHVRESANRSRKLGRTCTRDGLVYSCATFELNERGQGFSSCLLDVSSFPVGTFNIKWQSCCIDTEDSYWSLVSLSMGPVFCIKKDSATC